MSLIGRIDMALQKVGKTRSGLATEMGISPQSFTNLQRRPGSTMRPDNVAHIARILRCNLYWLCTGEGGEYVPEVTEPEHSLLARDAAAWLDAMSDADRWKAFGMLYQMTRGHWPSFLGALARPGSCGPSGLPRMSHPSEALHQMHP